MNATTGDVFVSYASEDRERVGPIVEALESAGLSVWWDRRIRAGRSFDKDIETALDAASCVLVVWSETSVQSDWVRVEAGEGMDRGVLVPIAIDDVRPPLAFRRLQTLNVRPHVMGDLASMVDAVRAVVPETHHDEKPPTPVDASGAPAHAQSAAPRTQPRIAIIAQDGAASHVADVVGREMEGFLSATPTRVWVSDDGKGARDPRAAADRLDADYLVVFNTLSDAVTQRLEIRLANIAAGAHLNAGTVLPDEHTLADLQSLARAAFTWLDSEVIGAEDRRLAGVAEDALDVWGLLATSQPSIDGIERLKRTVTRFPESALAHARLAHVATIGFVAMRLPETVTNRALITDHASRALSLAPTDPHVLRSTSYALSLLGRADLGLPQSEEAALRFPPYRMSQCFPLTRLGRGLEAVALLDDARRWAFPDIPGMWTTCAEAYTAARMWDEVETVARRGMFRSAFVDMPLRVHYANALGMLDRTDEARRQWRSVLEIAPTLTVDAWKRGWRMQLADQALVEAFTGGLERARLDESTRG